MAQSADRLQAAVDAILPDALDLSHRVHANPEIAYEERQAASLDLRAHGAPRIRGERPGRRALRPPSWHADPGPDRDRSSRSPGSTTPLPEVGHGCGHNLMCSSSAGAAVAAARALGRDFAGEIRFIGTPAEEAGNGKVTIIAGGRLRRRRRGAPDPPVGSDELRDRLPGDHRRRRDLPWKARPRQLRPVAREERSRRARAALHDGRAMAAAPEAGRTGPRDHHPWWRGAEHRARPHERSVVPAHAHRRGPRSDDRPLPRDGRGSRTGDRHHRRG